MTRHTLLSSVLGNALDRSAAAEAPIRTLNAMSRMELPRAAGEGWEAPLPPYTPEQASLTPLHLLDPVQVRLDEVTLKPGGIEVVKNRPTVTHAADTSGFEQRVRTWLAGSAKVANPYDPPNAECLRGTLAQVINRAFNHPRRADTDMESWERVARVLRNAECGTWVEDIAKKMRGAFFERWPQETLARDWEQNKEAWLRAAHWGLAWLSCAREAPVPARPVGGTMTDPEIACAMVRAYRNNDQVDWVTQVSTKQEWIRAALELRAASTCVPLEKLARNISAAFEDEPANTPWEHNEKEKSRWRAAALAGFHKLHGNNARPVGYEPNASENALAIFILGEHAQKTFGAEASNEGWSWEEQPPHLRDGWMAFAKRVRECEGTNLPMFELAAKGRMAYHSAAFPGRRSGEVKWSVLSTPLQERWTKAAEAVIRGVE